MSILTKEVIQKILNDDWLLMDDCEGHENCTVIKELASMALAAMNVEPFAYIIQDKYERERGVEGHLSRSHVSKYVSQEDINEHEITCTPLYRHAQQPVVPEEITIETATIIAYGLPTTNIGAIFKAGHDACRAAMLKAQPQNEPQNIPEIIPGWIPVSERMPEKNQNVLISVNFDSDLVEPLICSARYTGSTFRRGDATVKPGVGIEEATHWIPLPAAPQEVKGE